ncbi:MAG TPA: SDR family oxidoreductase [Steroidobacteraceae bacterium]|nr:SDR family oxidoreductase [Steroidobacteraceae bacterium]
MASKQQSTGKKKQSSKQTRPPQRQRPPGLESRMRPRPASKMREYRAAGRLEGQVALVTGGDSGIGRAVAIAFAKEGADVAIAYLSEHSDARETVAEIEKLDRRCVAIAADLGDVAACRRVVERAATLGRLDVLVNNAAMQVEQDRFEDITPQQLERTFRTNVFAMFHVTRHALAHMRRGARIINTASVTAYRGSPHLIDYASTKGAIVAFTRSLALSLVERGIRVNAVAPGPVWTPLIPASFSPEDVQTFGADVPLGRPAEPDEIAPCFVFLASDDAAFFVGQVLHPNGGEIINT